MDTQIIVAGAGPVGLMLAGAARLGGAQVTVVDRLTEPTTESRASTLHARTMELFDQLGLLTWLGTPPTEPRGHFGGIPLDFGALPSRFPGLWKVPQARVEALLANWALGLGVRILRGHELLGLTVTEEAVRATVHTTAGPRELTAAYLVGCDGEDSAVRRLAGIEFPGVDATRELLRADVVGVYVPDRRFERLPDGLAIASTRDAVTRVMVSSFERPAGPRTMAPTFEELCKLWHRVTGDDISTGTCTWVNAFDNASRQAARYRAGRILLAGDAAHNQLPAGGQAINLGIQDAMNLGWKLAAEVTGRAPTGLLDTYHDERHAAGRRALANIEAQSLLLLGDASVDATRAVLRELIAFPAVRDRLTGAISGLDTRYGDDPNPLVGARLPDVDLAGRGGLTGLLRAGRGVLLDLTAGRAADRWWAAIDRWVGRVHVVPATAPAGPLDGLAAVLVRPDGHVVWAGERDADPWLALRRWFGPPTR